MKLEKTIPCEICGRNIFNSIMYKTISDYEPYYICIRCFQRLQKVDIINGEETNLLRKEYPEL